MTTREEACHLHPSRWGSVLCQRCERPICTQCMIPAAVGFQCPECVQTAARGQRQWTDYANPSMPVTKLLIGLNLAVFVAVLLLEGGFSVYGGGATQIHFDFALYAPLVDFGTPPVLVGGEIQQGGQWWRIITSAFLHYGLLHIGMNMLILLLIGRLLEPGLGGFRFGLLYAASLFGGSLGALLFEPEGLTAGASGAVFGCAAAVVVAERAGAARWGNSGMAGLLLINIVLSFLIPNISIGGHLGGLVAGALAALAIYLLPRRLARRDDRSEPGPYGWPAPGQPPAGAAEPDSPARFLPDLAVAGIGAAAAVLAIYVAAPAWMNPVF